MLLRLLGIATSAIVLITAQAAAHRGWIGPNGGLMISAGPFHVELLVKDTEYRVNVFDQLDKPISVAEAMAVATVTGDEGVDEEKVALKPVASNSFAGAGSMKRLGATLVLVLVRIPNTATAVARFDMWLPQRMSPVIDE